MYIYIYTTCSKIIKQLMSSYLMRAYFVSFFIKGIDKTIFTTKQDFQ